MTPPYTSMGRMVQDPNGTYMAAADDDGLRRELLNGVTEKFEAMKRGELRYR